jgi:glycosyltransferase involved in cell wall biosynthesis/tetratricopeptide (TPR) repeat protein
VNSAEGTNFILQNAINKFNQGQLTQVEALCKTILKKQPEQAKASHLLGQVYQRLGRYWEAVQLLRSVGDATKWQDLTLRYHYGEALTALAAGLGTVTSAKLRLRYKDWQDGLAKRDDQDDLHSALQTVFTQSYSNLELIVIDTTTEQPGQEAISELLDRSPFPVVMEQRPGFSHCAALNEAVKLSKGEYVNPIGIGDAFAARRIEELIENVSRRDLQWGFSACTLSTATGEDIPTAVERFRDLYQTLSGGLTSANTAGSVLLCMGSPVLSTGSLFFSRALYDQLGGFTGLEFAMDTDFALRALWMAEPGLVPKSLIDCDLDKRYADGRLSNRAQQEQGEILKSYFQKAESNEPPNNFAPAHSSWGFDYVTCAIQGKQTRVPIEVLFHLEDELEKHRQINPDGLPVVESAGLNLVGLFRGDLGLAESVRITAHTCAVSGIPVSLDDAGVNLGTRQSNRSYDHLFTDDCPHPNTLLYLNPGQIESAWHRLKHQGKLEGRRIIGMWYWELDQLPRQWLPALDMLDEIWVASEFVRQTVQRETDKAVVRIPHPIEIDLSRKYDRSEFNLPDDTFLFLFNFDFNSYTHRKNPQAVLEAFRLAFPAGSENVSLVIKSTGAAGHREQFEQLLSTVASDSRIHLIDQQLSREAMYGLQSICDAYVSLHRAEGLGLGMAECMAMGKPVIGTAYSGNLDFMTAENSCLVDYELIPVKPDQYHGFEAGWMWADPDVAMAADHMQRLAEDPGLRDRIGGQAAIDIQAEHSFEAVGKAIRERLASF